MDDKIDKIIISIMSKTEQNLIKWDKIENTIIRIEKNRFDKEENQITEESYIHNFSEGYITLNSCQNEYFPNMSYNNIEYAVNFLDKNKTEISSTRACENAESIFYEVERVLLFSNFFYTVQKNFKSWNIQQFIEELKSLEDVDF